MKRKLDTSNIHWRKVDITNRDIEKWDQSKSKIQQSRHLSRIVLCAACKAICVEMWTPKGLGSPTPLVLLMLIAVIAFFPRQALLPPYSFPQTNQIAGFLLLGSPLHAWLYIQSVPYYPLRAILSDLPGLLKSVWKPSWAYGPSILHASITSAMWLILKSAGAVARFSCLLGVPVKSLNHFALWIQFWGSSFLGCCHYGT